MDAPAGSASADAVAVLVALACATIGYTLVVVVGALRTGKQSRVVAARRVRQEHRLTRRSWLELGDSGATMWVPVFSDPALSAMPSPAQVQFDGRSVVWDGTRLFRSGRIIGHEPPGRLIDNPSSAGDPNAIPLMRRLLLDAQSAVAAPVLGLVSVAILGGGFAIFAGATVVWAATTTWLSAIRGSDAS